MRCGSSANAWCRRCATWTEARGRRDPIQIRLPESLQDVLDGRRLLELPVDPANGNPYEYLADTDAFRLCAEFERPSADTTALVFWAHPAGRHCFEFDVRTIAPGDRPPALMPIPAPPAS